MAIRKRKPTSPGRRFQTSSDFADITKDKPEKRLTKPKPKTGGRNSYGRMTSRHRGGGHKQRYRVIDFKRNKDGVPAKVAAIEYDPNRNARIALLHYYDGEKRYILAAAGLNVGDVLQSGQGSEIRTGNALPLRYIPVGTTVHNVELKPGAGGKMGRGAGASIQLIAKEGAFATVRLPSTEMRRVPIDCRATIGEVGNSEIGLVSIGKAGRNRWKGHRPKVRGVAINYLPQPEPNWLWDFTIVLAERVQLLDGTEENVDTEAEVLYLEGLFRDGNIIQFTDVDGTLWASDGPGVLMYTFSEDLRYLDTDAIEGDIRLSLLEAVEAYE